MCIVLKLKHIIRITIMLANVKGLKETQYFNFYLIKITLLGAGK